MPVPRTPPLVLAIGGSDCSAGAGIQADLKAIHDNGGYGLTVVTGVVAETPQTVVAYEAVSQTLVRQQLECLLEAFPVAVIKIGLLFTPELASAVGEVLAEREIPLVIDPVGAASSGTVFGGEEYRTAIAETFFSRAALITPNLPEARLFLNQEGLSSLALATVFSDLYQAPVLLKGGHANQNQNAEDLYASNGEVIRSFSASRLNVPDLHGTGCTLASAIATHLAQGKEMEEAIASGKCYLRDLMSHYRVWVSEEGSQVHALGRAQ